MSLRADTSSLISGALVASAYPGLGALGATMKATWTAGEHGPSPLANDNLSDTLEYRWYAETVPAGCSVALTELGVAEFSAPADGTYIWTYRLVESGALLSATGSVTVAIGAVSATVDAVGAVVHAGTAAISASVTGPVTATVDATGAVVHAGTAAISATISTPSAPATATVDAAGAVVHAGTAAISATVVTPGGALTDDEMRQMFTWVSELARIHGLVAGSPLTVTSSTRHAGGVTQSITEAGGTVTVARL